VNASAPHNSLYTGWIRHRRFTPVHHEFRMPIAMLCINIDEWKNLFEHIPFWSSTRFNLGWLREADYLAHVPGTTLRDRVHHTLQQTTGQHLSGPVLLLTHPRYFGFAMNPISCFYCYGADGITLQYLVAEVTNTPWKERFAYVIPCDARQRQQHAQFSKQMHVSPFNPMDMTYDIRFNAPQAKHYVQLENHDDHDRVITDATLVLQQQSLGKSALLNLLWRFPLMTVQVGAGIYWQALKLWCKGARYHAHRPLNTSLSLPQESSP
jgi:DUF1365 family protein